MRFFGIANPMPLPEGVPPLVFARTEVEEISRLFGDQAKVLYDNQATRKAVMEQLRTAEYLHLSCHGQFNSWEPLESGILLSDAEQLTVTNLISTGALANARLAVLSACQTAITDFNELPEEAIGLPGGFIQAGFPGVVGSLWPVNDMSTALLMIRFYENHLMQKQSPAEALRNAQLWLRDVTNAELADLFAEYKMNASDATTRMAYATAQEKFREHTLAEPNAKPFEHPYYWAAFAFYGA
jgi:CHAT domain-containing protein